MNIHSWAPALLLSIQLMAGSPTILPVRAPIVFLEGGSPWPSHIQSAAKEFFGPEQVRQLSDPRAVLTETQKRAVLAFPYPYPTGTVSLTPGAAQSGKSYLAAIWCMLRGMKGNELILVPDYSTPYGYGGIGLTFEAVPGKTYILDLYLKNNEAAGTWDLWGPGASTSFSASTSGSHHPFAFTANHALEYILLLYNKGPQGAVGTFYSATLKQVD
jgi:hypothetical protein